MGGVVVLGTPCCRDTSCPSALQPQPPASGPSCCCCCCCCSCFCCCCCCSNGLTGCLSQQQACLCCSIYRSSSPRFSLSLPPFNIAVRERDCHAAAVAAALLLLLSMLLLLLLFCLFSAATKTGATGLNIGVCIASVSSTRQKLLLSVHQKTQRLCISNCCST